MPFCPCCRYEYEDWVESCPDCSVSLVAELDDEVELDEDEAAVWEYANPVLLKTVYSSFEAEQMNVLLNDSGIKVLIKSRNPGGVTKFMVGQLPHDGADIYVPAEELERAKDIVAVLEGDEPAEEIQDVDIDDFSDEPDGSKPKKSASVIVTVLIFVVLGLAIMFIDKLLDIIVGLFQ